VILLSHPTGNSGVRQTILAIQELNLLEAFYTTLGISEKTLSHLPQYIQAILFRRAYAVDSKKLHTYPNCEIIRLIGKALNLNLIHTDTLYRNLDHAVEKNLHRHATLKSVYAYEDGSYATFREAKKRGIRTIYELPIAYWKTAHTLLAEEALRYPEWKPTIGAMYDNAEKCARKEAEIELADVIICPSDFVLKSIPEKIRSQKRCHLAHYGTKVQQLSIENHNEGPLRVLFVGSMSQRKGLADLFEAMKLLPKKACQLQVLGTPLMPISFYKKAYSDFELLSPRPHCQVMECMSQADVLVLPSIVEGRALVQLEALSCGLPLIITPNTGGEDLIDPGQTGFLIPIRSPEAIAEKITWLLDDRDACLRMKTRCLQKAFEVDWRYFRAKIKHILTS
jgi:glycosyltransferase involved in cell wall biosynthesis